MPSYIVYGLPRSRTFWLSSFLSYADWQCGHDELLHCRGMDDIKSWLSQPCTGTVETLAAPFWRLAKDVKTVVVRRPVEQVVASIKEIGLFVDETIIRRLDHKLDQIERRVPNVLSVTFDDLRSEATCKRVFEFCLPYQHDTQWWQHISKMNLQIQISHVIRYYNAHRKQLEKLAKIAKYHTIVDLNRNLVEFDKDDGMVFQQEKFNTWFRDATHLFEKHLIVVGEAPDAYLTKNLDAMKTLEDVGNLQITTARMNGRMFGYLMTVIGPSLESPDIKVAHNTTYFSDPSFVGLGKKLQLESLRALQEKDVDELYLHAGVRGSGPRLGSLYKRMGAEPYGQWYKLNLTCG